MDLINQAIISKWLYFLIFIIQKKRAIPYRIYCNDKNVWGWRLEIVEQLEGESICCSSTYTGQFTTL